MNLKYLIVGIVESHLPPDWRLIFFLSKFGLNQASKGLFLIILCELNVLTFSKTADDRFV